MVYQSLARCAVVGALFGLATPAQAQFGGLRIPSLSSSSSSNSSAKESDGCPEGSSKNAGSAMIGGLLGGAAKRVARSAGVSSWLPMAAFADVISSAIACKLDPKEQEQAAEATLAATRSDEVGSTAEWTSSTRENVSGRSTVVARNEASADGLDCITVSDVIIVSGEETTANKRMCKPKGSARYSLMA